MGSIIGIATTIFGILKLLSQFEFLFKDVGLLLEEWHNSLKRHVSINKAAKQIRKAEKADQNKTEEQKFILEQINARAAKDRASYTKTVTPPKDPAMDEINKEVDSEDFKRIEQGK